MRTKLFILASILLSLCTRAQEINGTHAFAIGTPDGVNITWDAYGDEPIQGCLIYKERAHTEEFKPELITPELLTSSNSVFSFTDLGEFHLVLPPVYYIYAVTHADTTLVHVCYAFRSIEFVVLDSTHVSMTLLPWIPEECCASVKVLQNEIFMIEAGYDEYFQMTIDLNYLLPGDYYEFMLMSAHPELYARLTVTRDYVYYLTQSLGIEDKPMHHILSQNIPNPFSTETSIRFDLKEKSLVSMEVYSMDGRWVESLINKTLTPGLHSFTFSKGNLKPGVYLYRLTTGREVSVRRMVVN